MLSLTVNVAALVLLLAVASNSSASDAPLTATPGSRVRLSPIEREHVLDGKYRLIRRVADIPTEVRAAFSGAAFSMADPGEPYQATDVLAPGKTLPARRLVFAGCSPARCFVHYERGGRGHGYYVVVFMIDPFGATTFHWGGAGFRGAADIDELRSKIRSGEFADDLQYYW